MTRQSVTADNSRMALALSRITCQDVCTAPTWFLVFHVDQSNETQPTDVGHICRTLDAAGTEGEFVEFLEFLHTYDSYLLLENFRTAHCRKMDTFRSFVEMATVAP